jgi:curli biogenesis system outer membrane secretion channel CsgG
MNIDGNKLESRGMFKRISLVLLVALVAGCNASAPPPVSQLGNYRPGVEGIAKPTIAVAPVKLSGQANQTDVAADQLADLLSRTNRFNVIPRAQLANILQQQSATDAIKPGALVRPVKLPGVDYLVVSSVSNLAVSKQLASDMWTKMKKAMRNSQTPTVIVTVNCGVGLNFVDPATGEVVLTSNTEFRREETAENMGLYVPQSTTAPIDLTEQDRMKIVQLALDDAVRKSLYNVDEFLAKRNQPAANPLAAPAAAPAANPFATPPANPLAKPAAPAQSPAATAPANPLGTK